MGALGFNISIKKGEKGSRGTLSGIEFQVADSYILLTFLVKFLSDLQDRLKSWDAKGRAEERRREARADTRPKEHLFVVKDWREADKRCWSTST